MVEAPSETDLLADVCLGGGALRSRPELGFDACMIQLGGDRLGKSLDTAVDAPLRAN